MNNFTESLPKAGHVNEVCKEWLVREDGALAYKLQSQEINDFYKGNRFRNAVVREDFPTALNEQIKEKENADKQAEAYRRRLIEQEEYDKRVAKEIADKLERDLMEQQQKELLESEVIAQQMQEIYVNLPPPPPPVSRDKSRPPPRPAKASTLQQQISLENGRADNHSLSSHQAPNQNAQLSQSYMLQSNHFANNDNYVGISLATSNANSPSTPSRQKSSPQSQNQNPGSSSIGGAYVVSGENESPSRNPFASNHSAEHLKKQDRSPIILTNEHFLNQQQTQNQNQHHHRHQHSISSTSTTSSTASGSASASASARRNVFEYHNLPNSLIAPTTATSAISSVTPTKTHSPKHTLNHTANPPTTPNSNQLNSPTLSSSNHPDIDELIEYSDVADSIRRYDMSEKKSSNKESLESSSSSSSLKHSNFSRILSPSNENLLRNDKKFQKLSPEKYDQLVGNENGGVPIGGAAAERYMQEHADDIELYVDPCDYASLQEIGLPMHEIKEMSKKLKQEQKDELLARRLQQMEAHDGLTQEARDRMMAIEAQDKELAKMLQEREKAKAKRAKEKARLRKSQQKEVGSSGNSSSLCSTSNGLHCGPILPLPQDCMSSCTSSSKHSSSGSHKHSPQPMSTSSTMTQSQSEEALDNEAYSNPIDVLQNQRSPNGLLTNGSLTRDNAKINRLQTSQSHDDDIYTLPVDSCRSGQRPTSLQVPEESIPISQHSSMTRSENFSHEMHDTLNGHDTSSSSRLNYSKTNSFDHSSSPTPPYMPIQGSRRMHAGEDRKKKSKDNKCTHQ